MKQVYRGAGFAEFVNSTEQLNRVYTLHCRVKKALQSVDAARWTVKAPIRSSEDWFRCKRLHQFALWLTPFFYYLVLL
jgi:hypothetical protein